MLHRNGELMKSLKYILVNSPSNYTCLLCPLFRALSVKSNPKNVTVKILKIGTPEIITIIALQLEQMDFTVQYCVQKMQTK